MPEPTYHILSQSPYGLLRAHLSVTSALVLQRFHVNEAHVDTLAPTEVQALLRLLPPQWLVDALAAEADAGNPFFALDDVPSRPCACGHPTEEHPLAGACASCGCPGYHLDDAPLPFPTRRPEDEALCFRCYQPRHAHHRLDAATLRCSLHNPNTFLAMGATPETLTLDLDPDALAQLHAEGMGFAEESDEAMAEALEELARLMPDKPTCGRCGEAGTHVHREEA